MLIKQYVVKINDESGEPRETVCFDTLSAEEQARLLREVFAQGLARLGYVQSQGKGC